MDPTIAEIIRSFDLDDYRPIVARELDLGEPLAPRAGNLVTVVTGMRRSGKTYRLFQEMERLAGEGVDPGRMLYFNFEDSRLGDVAPATGDAVLDAFYTLHPQALPEGAYLFFDELQEMRDWGLWLRRVVDTRKATIYATGSSSRMLSEEIATGFRGRSVSFEQAPYSFREYAGLHEPGCDVDARAVSTGGRLALQRQLDGYLRRGGFPAAQGLSEQRSVLLLQSYMRQVVTRDVIERHDLGSPQAVSLFAQAAVGANGRTLSLRKIANDFKSRGVTAPRAMLGQVLGHLEDAFLVATVKERSRVLRENDNTLPKVYAVDPGLLAANVPAGVSDGGQRLEQAVYLELRRREGAGRRGTVSFLKTRGHAYEVDFAVGDALFDEGLRLYQVALSLADPAVRERETRALWEAMGETGCGEATVIVKDGAHEELEGGAGTIHVVPAWDWLRQRPGA